jgi:hypothetical protein
MAKSSTRQKVLLGVLLVVAAYYVVNTFVLSDSAPKSRVKPQGTTASSAGAKTGSVTAAKQQKEEAKPVTQQELLQQLLADRTPLELELLSAQGGEVKRTERGNIFAYWVPPPPPLEKPPPPPPIVLSFIQPQSAVAGTPRTFTLTVTGRGYSADAQILLDGRPWPTKRVSDTQLAAEVPPGEYSIQRNMTIEVKSKSEPAKLYSNPLTFVVQPPPEPPFKYIGRIGDLGVFEMAGTKEVARLTSGDTIQRVWRIDAIRDDGVEVTHTQYEIKRRVLMQDKGR